MKRTSALIITSILLISQFAYAKAITYQITPANTNITWHTYVFGLFNIYGTCKATGTVTTTNARHPVAIINVNINPSSISTGHPMVDKQLQGEGFFDAKNYPIIAFQGKHINLEKSEATINGNIHLRNQLKPISLYIKTTSKNTNRHQQLPDSISASTMLNRFDFGMTSLAGLVSRYVYIDIAINTQK